MTIRSLPWRPPSSGEIETQPAGRSWDAVRVPSLIGVRALTLLGDDSGAVIADAHGAVWYWLVAPGAASDWTLCRVLSAGSYVAVPPAHRTGGSGLHWRVAPEPCDYLTDPGRLHSALLAAAQAVKPCERCDRLTDQPVAVAETHGASNPGRTVYACPDCAPHFPKQLDPLDQAAAGRRALEGRAR
ncbi:hypothetical protein LRS74_30130 [Streptomyces sp. LX-29]|uniref:hypothetical protein n=1 Tax=Streptomyces sp. LX-29 TaxID=2900152 RepID=UPI00240D2091|nr:hypothetical protein [Streptomyces sp. LX-29]WFB10830.1 hypothetical protein LRS74_30130 [Streptomyces sp. LX-29]